MIRDVSVTGRVPGKASDVWALAGNYEAAPMMGSASPVRLVPTPGRPSLRKVLLKLGPWSPAPGNEEEAELHENLLERTEYADGAGGFLKIAMTGVGLLPLASWTYTITVKPDPPGHSTVEIVGKGLYKGEDEYQEAFL